VIVNAVRRFTRDKVERWIALFLLSAFLGVYTAELIVYLPDWIREFLDFWVYGMEAQ
jgi:hypothetical protein